MFRPDSRQKPQRDLLETYLDDIIDTRHELVILGKRIDWSACEGYFGPMYASNSGRPAMPVRLQVGLQLLKHIYGLSDLEVLKRWTENPYWQHFCGEITFQHRLPMDETTMLRFRQRIGEEGARELLKMTIKLAEETGTVAPESFKVVVADTTVMPKAITHPTDAKLVSRCHRQLVELAKEEGIRFKQTFIKVLDKLVWNVGRYAHARQFGRMHKHLKKMHSNLIRICEAVINQKPFEERSQALNDKFYQALRLLDQYGDPSIKQRLYSLHEPHVVCITKGKAHQRHEFGAKVSVVTTAAEGLVLDCQSLNGNPYDGHTVEPLLRRLKDHLEELPEHLLVDRGYKGSDKTHLCQVHITGRKQGRGKAHEQQHRRNSIEPIIGHMKSEGLLDRCHLHGALGDKTHAVLCGVGMNLRKILKKLAELLLGRKKWGFRGLWLSLLATLQGKQHSLSNLVRAIKPSLAELT
ncbi:IS5 family transposase [Vibrio cholerae]